APAERPSATARATAEALGNRIEQGDLGAWRARMLEDRDGPGDREAAAALAAEVAARYRELGLPRHAAGISGGGAPDDLAAVGGGRTPRRRLGAFRELTPDRVNAQIPVGRVPWCTGRDVD